MLFPFYALADRSLGAGWRAVTGRAPQATLSVSPRNYLRVPAMASGLLLLMFFPGIIRQGSASYQRATGLTQQPFLGRWLLLTGVFFAVERDRLRRRHAARAPPGWTGRRRTPAGPSSEAGARTREPGR